MPVGNTKKLYLLKFKLIIPCLVFADIKIFCTLLPPQDKDKPQLCSIKLIKRYVNSLVETLIIRLL